MKVAISIIGLTVLAISISMFFHIIPSGNSIVPAHASRPSMQWTH